MVGIQDGAKVSRFKVLAWPVVTGHRRTVRRKIPDYSSVVEKVGEDEDGSFVNMG